MTNAPPTTPPEINNFSSPLGQLRRVTEQDSQRMHSWRNAPSIRENMFTTHEITLNEHQRWFAAMMRNPKQRYFIYEPPDDHTPAGVVAFTDIDTEHQHVVWAFYAAPNAPRGIGRKMEFLALNYAFDVLNAHKLSCEVLDYNRSVLNLHQKFGFQIEGQFKEHHLYQQRFCDVYRLALFRRDWFAQRDKVYARMFSHM